MLQTYFGRISDEMRFAGQAFALWRVSAPKNERHTWMEAGESVTCMVGNLWTLVGLCQHVCLYCLFTDQCTQMSSIQVIQVGWIICLPPLHQYLDQRKKDIRFWVWTVLISSASGPVYNTQHCIDCTSVLTSTPFHRSDLRRDHVYTEPIPLLKIFE